jgi:hypothetical protein
MATSSSVSCGFRRVGPVINARIRTRFNGELHDAFDLLQIGKWEASHANKNLK